MTRVKVLGLGNVLLGDDGLGPYVIQVLLAQWEFPPAVEVRDLGTPGLDLIPYVSEADALVLVDTVRADGRPGELRRYGLDDLLHSPLPARVSPHDPGLQEALFALEFERTAPADVTLIGVIPGESKRRPGLGTSVHAAVPRVVEAVVRELERLGVPPLPRVRPEEPDIWWERRPCTS